MAAKNALVKAAFELRVCLFLKSAVTVYCVYKIIYKHCFIFDLVDTELKSRKFNYDNAIDYCQDIRKVSVVIGVVQFKPPYGLRGFQGV